MGILTQTHNGLNFLGTEAYIQADGSTKMTIKSSGNVGIGTTGPDQKLHVAGNAKVTGVIYTNYVQTLGGTSIDFRHQDASTVMRVDTANAKVGIGTTSPGAKLEVASTGSNGSSGLSDYGFVVTTSNGTDQPTLGAESTGDGYANLNLGSNISGTRRFWHISKRKATDSHKLSFFYYDGSSFSEPFHFETNGVLNVNGTDITSTKINNWNTAYGWGNHASAGYLTSVPSEYLTQNEGDARYVSFEKEDRAVPNTGGWYRLAKISRGAGRFSISYTGGHMSPHTYVIDAFKNWNNEATIAVEKFGHANYITSFRISRADGAGNNDYYLEGYFSSITNTHSFEARFQEILGYNNISEIFAVSSSSTLVASTATDDETIESLTTTANEGLYLKNMNLDGRLNLYTDSNTTSTTALVLNGTEVEKRTLGSAAFNASTDFVAVSGDTMTGQLIIQKTGDFTAAKFKGTGANGYGSISIENDLGTALVLGSMGSTKTGTFFDNARYIAASSGELVLKTSSSTDGHMKFLSGGQNERMRIAAGGNIGIGTTSPAYKLDVVGNVRIQSSNEQQIRFVHYQGSGDEFSIEHDTTGIYFYNRTDSAGMFRINNDGSIRLHQYGAGYLKSDASGNITVDTSTIEDTLDSVTDRGSTTTNNISVGTLTASGGGNTVVLKKGTGTPALAFAGTSDEASALIEGISGGGLKIYTSNGGTLETPAWSNKMTVTAGGNVGIGTTSPNYKLHVDGNIGIGEYLQHAGDNNTYLRFTTDLIRLVTGSVEMMRFSESTTQNAVVVNEGGADVDFRVESDTDIHALFLEGSSGNVGIGTGSPTRPLSVEGTAYVRDDFAVTVTAPATNAQKDSQLYLQSKGNQSGTIRSSQWYFQTESDSIYGNSGLSISKKYDGGSTSEYLRITSAGSVGIGTTSPSYKLDVAGTSRSDLHIFRSNQSAPTADAFIFRPADNTVALGTANAERMRIDSSGNVGIGTTSPNAKLEVRSDGSAAGGAEIRLQHANNNSTDVVSTLNFANNVGSVAMIQSGTTGANNTGYISFFTDNAGTSSEKMRILGNGNVGIGTTNPVQTLEIHNPDASGYTHFGIKGTGHKYVIGVGNDSVSTVNDKLYFYDNDNSAFRAVLDTSGNFGIGTTAPATKLDVNGITTSKGFQTNTTNADYNLLSRNNGGNATLYVQAATTTANQPIAQFSYGSSTANAGTKVLLVAKDKTYFANTNVGIGTTDPAEKLHVAGNIRATGWIGENSSNRIEFDESNNLNFYVNGVWVAQMQPDGDLHVKGDVIAFSSIFDE